MIEIEIPKDITKYESKLIGPFSLREVVGLGLAIGCAFIANSVMKNLGVDGDIKGFLTLVFAVPGILIGWYKPYGMPFEQFVLSCFKLNVLAPSYRYYNSISPLEQKYKRMMNKDTKETNPIKEFKKPKPPKEKKHKDPDMIGFL